MIRELEVKLEIEDKVTIVYSGTPVGVPPESIEDVNVNEVVSKP